MWFFLKKSSIISGQNYALSSSSIPVTALTLQTIWNH